MRPLLFLLLLTLVTVDGRPALADEDSVAPPPVFRLGRPVHAVVVGGSVAAYENGNFGDFLTWACGKVEVANLAKSRLGASAIAQRFRTSALKSAGLVPRPKDVETWLVSAGGLNSVGMPEATALQMMQMFRLAHGAGMNVLALSLTPWGAESDPRWRGLAGIRRHAATRKIVDFVLGRLSPAEALGRYAKGLVAWGPGDLPDTAVDLYNSELRDLTAALRPEGPLLAELAHGLRPARTSGAIRTEDDGAEGRSVVEQARELPRWFLKKELVSFDPIHPNREGHRLIAAKVCPSLPTSWGCDCSLLQVTGAKPVKPKVPTPRPIPKR